MHVSDMNVLSFEWFRNLLFHHSHSKNHHLNTERAQPTNRALEATSSDEAETPVIVGPPDFDEWWGKLESIKQQKYKNTPVSDNMKKTFILNLWNIFSKKTDYKTSDNEPPRWRKSKKNRFEATTSKKTPNLKNVSDNGPPTKQN